MVFIVLISLIILQIQESSTFSSKEKLSDSYIPAGIQTVYHYMSELYKYQPYTYTIFCQFPLAGKNSETKYIPKSQTTGGDTTKSNIPPIPLITDICVTETLSRLNSLLIDFGKEATEKNLNNFQGFSHSILNELESTSRMTSIQQLYFILKKLMNERIYNEGIKCQMSQLIQDFENPKSKLYRNFLNVKPLNYLN